MKKLISYVASSSEESTLESFCYKMSLNEAEFWSSTEVFLKAFSNLSKMKGFGEKKLKNLKSIADRISTNQSINHEEVEFYPASLWSMAEDRYESLAKRNFDRIMYELFHEKVYFVVSTKWEFGFTKQDFLDHKDEFNKLINNELYYPTFDWLNHTISQSIQDRIKTECDKKMIRRFRNLMKEEWEHKHEKLFKQLFKEYLYKGVYSKDLSFKDFSAWYKTNEFTERKCEYCGITEQEIKRLFDSDKIYTKRIYSRGMSMEVDKRDPRKPYELKNLVMSCYWCNNAKTDEFSEEEFHLIASAISSVWKSRLK